MFDENLEDLQWLVDLCDKAEGAGCDLMWGNELVYIVNEQMFCIFTIENKAKVAMTFRPADAIRENCLEQDGITAASFPAEGGWLKVPADACQSPANPQGISRDILSDWIKASYEFARGTSANDG